MNKKLTSQEAQQIIDRVASGERQQALALEYNLSSAAISKLIRGLTWPDLHRPAPLTPRPPCPKLSESQVQEILDRLYLRRESPSVIAPFYGVTRQAISDIAKGKSWAHLPRPARNPSRRRVWEQ